MADFTNVTLSAGAMSTGLVCNQINLLSKQRRDNQEVQESLAEVEGNAQLVSGEKQKNALVEESKQTGFRAAQTFTQGIGNIASEASAAGVERRGQNSLDKTLQSNVEHYEAWDHRLNSKEGANPVVGLGGAAEMSSPISGMTDAEIKDHLQSIHRNSDRNAVDPKQLTPDQNTAIDLAKRRNLPELMQLKEDVRRSLKDARKAKDSAENGIERARNQRKTIVTSLSEVGQGGFILGSAASQKIEAEIKLEQSQADFLKDSLGRTNRSLEETNSALGSSIAGILAAANKEWESNARA